MCAFYASLFLRQESHVTEAGFKPAMVTVWRSCLHLSKLGLQGYTRMSGLCGARGLNPGLHAR